MRIEDGQARATPAAQLGQQPVNEGGVNAVGRTKGFNHATVGILIEIEPGGAEGKVEVGDDGFDTVLAGQPIGDVVGDG